MRLGEKRLFQISERKRSKIGRTAFVTVVFVGVLCVFVYALSVLRPAFIRLAETKAKELAVRAIHETVAKTVSKESVDGIVEFKSADDEKITAVTSNLAQVSNLKSDLNLKILHSISALDTATLSVPLGSLTGNEFLYGTGPDISFNIKPYGTVVTDIETTFVEAGINQTKCEVALKIKANLSVLMPTAHKTSTVETTVPVVQTVIVGDVPDSYTNVDREGLAYEDDVLQLAE